MSQACDELKAGLIVLAIMAETIREFGSIPSGHLYAQMMGRVSIDGYESAIRTLCGSTVIRRSGDVLHWNVVSTGS